MNLADAVTDILVRQKQIIVGKSYSEDSLISRPMPYAEVMEKINLFCREDVRDRVLTQEIIIYLALLVQSEPELLKGLLTLRVGYLILLITTELAGELQIAQDEAYSRLMQLSPSEIQLRLRQVVGGYEEMHQVVFQQEALHVNQQQQDIEWMVLSDGDESEPPIGGWLRKRRRDGAVNRVPKDFYPSVWRVMKHCKGLIIGDKLERRNRLDSDLILSEMTPGEKNFALLVEHLLNKIPNPEYRQVNTEALMALAALVERNPELQIQDYIMLDVVAGHGVRLAWLDEYMKQVFAAAAEIIQPRYEEHKAAAWRSFYESSPFVCASYVVRALQFLIELGETGDG
jgi:phosphorylase kinase alpha/beta subunit